ncbi:MAG: protein kinase domain-containing protein [Candidatus Promineifilaceae bacterium]
MQQLGRFTLQQEIGSGGMGSVYCAWDNNLQRAVALKLMHPQFAKQTRFRKQFLNEVRVTANFDHDHIVRVHQGGEIAEHGQLYMVMEYISGGTLSMALDSLRETAQRLPLRETLVLAEQVAQALAYTHSQRRVHRDIKPGNILIKQLLQSDSNGLSWRAVVTDFGLVKAALYDTDGHTRLHTALAGVGTPTYMSPEQARERPVGTQSDIYSLGIVLYELLTGELPLPIQSLVTAVRLHNTGEQPTPIHEHNPAVPPALVAIVMRALASDLGERYVSAEKLATDLRTFRSQLSATDIAAFDTPQETVCLADLLPYDNGCNPPRVKSQRGGTMIDGSSPAAAPEPYAGRRTALDQHESFVEYEFGTPSAPDAIRLALQPSPMLRLSPSGNETVYLQIINDSDLSDVVKLSLVGDATRFASLDVASLHLPPRSTQEVEIAFRLSAGCDLAAGSYEWSVSAELETTQQPLGTTSGTLVVRPVESLKLTAPPQVRHGKPFKLTIANGGNVPQTLRLMGYDTNAAIVYALPETALQVAAYQTMAVEITARLENRPKFSAAAPRLFQIHAKSGSETYKTSPFSQLNTPPVIPRPVLWLAMLSLIAGLLLTGWSLLPNLSSPAAEAPTPVVTTLSATSLPEVVVTTVMVEEVAVSAEIPTIEPVVVAQSQLEIGSSTQGNPIIAHRFGNQDDNARKVVFIGGIRSGFAPASVTIAEQLIDKYATGEVVAPDNVAVFIISNMNPDTTPDPNRESADRNANGVGLNSNFDCNWSGEGAAPFSEAETAAIRDFLLEQQPAATVFWSYSTTVPRMVASGQCNSTVSAATKLLQTRYASATQFDPRDFPSEKGDAVDWAAKVGLSAVFVMLEKNDGLPNIDLHLQGVQAVLQAVAAGELLP